MLILTTTCLLQVTNIYAQEFRAGERIVRNYSTMITQGSEQSWSIARDERGIMYFGSENKGVSCYDGHNWKRIDIRSNSSVQILATDSKGLVYVGAASEFGYISPDRAGNPVYTSLLTKLDSSEINQLGVVFSILVEHDKIIYSTQKKFYFYYPDSDSIRIIDHSESYRTVMLIWKVDDKVIVGDNTDGLFELKDEEMVPLEGGDQFSYTYVRSLVKGQEEGELIIGTYNRGLMTYNYNTGEVNENFTDPAIQEELREYKTYRAVSISEDLFAVSTTAFGVYVFNTGGELIERINTETSGLKDNAVTAIFHDENNGFPVLWVSNWGYLSKVYMGLPYKALNIEEWFNNALNEFCVYNDDLYLSNDAGVIRCIETDEGFGFVKMEGFTDQTFPLLNFKYGNTNLLLIGTINGMYSYDGSELKRLDEDEQGIYVRSLYQSNTRPQIVYVGLEKGGIRIIEYKNGKWKFRNKISYIDRENEIVINGSVGSIQEDDYNNLWFKTANPDGLYRVQVNENDTLIYGINESSGLESPCTMLTSLDDKLLISTDEGLMSYDHNENMFVPDSSFVAASLPEGIRVSHVYKDPDGGVWIIAVEPRNLVYYFGPVDDKDNSKKEVIYKPFYMMPNSMTFDIGYYNDHVWIVKSKELYIIDKGNLYHEYTPFNTLVRRVVISGDSTVFNGSFFSKRSNDKIEPSEFQTPVNIPEIDYSHNDISFFFSSPYYLEEDSIKFSYLLEGFDKEWSRWDYVNYRDYTNLPNGNYKFMVRGRDITGAEGNIAEYKFVILRPWYLSIGALLGYMIAAVLLVYLIIKLYTRRLINENIRLEGIVAERTAEVVRQKEELEASIHYASRIQRAILPTEDSLKGKVDDYFILFKPRDIVSGDFYWVSEKGSRLFIVAADCTGHGVPGAFMSILGVSFLDEIINKSEFEETDKILNELRKHVTESLKQMGKNDEETKDGMDMGLLVINYSDEVVEFSGAYNPCWKVRPLTDKEKEKYKAGEFTEEKGDLSNGEYILETIDADRMPIGISSRMGQSFTMHRQKMEKGVTYYIFSDGYSDQFGGDHGRKFLKKNMKKLILDIQVVPVKQQKELLEKRLIDWMGQMDQVDDILVMGIRASS